MPLDLRTKEAMFHPHKKQVLTANSSRQHFGPKATNLIVGNRLPDHVEPTQECMIPTAQRTNGTATRYGRVERESNARFGYASDAGPGDRHQKRPSRQEDDAGGGKNPWGLHADTRPSMQQKQLLRLDICTGLQTIEVHATRKIRTIKLDFVVSRLHFPIDELRSPLAEGAEDLESHV
jgi:hypothetical protein